MSRALAPWAGNRKWYALAVGLLASIGLCTSTVSASASTASPASTGQRYVIQNVNAGWVMSVPGDNIAAGQVINDFHFGAFQDQYWYTEPSASHYGYFYLQPQQNDTLCVTYKPTNTASLTLEPCGANAANGNPQTQLWTYNQYGVLSTIQGWAMSVPGASTAEEVPLNTFPYGPYVDQFWNLIAN